MTLSSSKKEWFSFAWDSSLLIVAGLMSSVCYFVLHLFLNRKMTPVDYSVLVSLLSLFKVMSVPSSAVSVGMARFVAQFSSENEISIWVTIVRRAVRKISVWGLVGLLIWIGVSGFIQDELRVPSRVSVIVLGIFAFVNLYAPILSGTLQGGRQFNWLATSGLAGAVSRLLICAVVVIVFGADITLILLAVVLSSLVALAVGAWPFRKLMLITPIIEGFDTGPMYRYLMPVVFGQGLFFLLTELDLILAPRFLQGIELAAYGKAAMLSRCVFLVTQPIATAMFPRAVVSGRRWIVLGPLLFSALISLCASCVVCFFPSIFMLIFAGKVEPMYLDLTRMYIWAAFPLSILSIATPYLWARDKMGHVLRLFPIVLLYILLRFRFSETPQQMIICLAAALWSSVVVLGVSMVDILRADAKNQGE